MSAPSPGGDADLMTITHNTNNGSNHSYTVASAPGVIAPTQARAMWLDEDTIAWNAAGAASYGCSTTPTAA